MSVLWAQFWAQPLTVPKNVPNHAGPDGEYVILHGRQKGRVDAESTSMQSMQTRSRVPACCVGSRERQGRFSLTAQLSLMATHAGTCYGVRTFPERSHTASPSSKALMCGWGDTRADHSQP